MAHPGVPRSPGVPLLEPAAEAAIRAARERAGLEPRSPFPFPQRRALTEAEREEVLKRAGAETCRLCGGMHAAPNTPACPRVATFELDGDGVKVLRGSFWPDGQWDASRVLFVADAAEEDGNDGTEAP